MIKIFTRKSKNNLKDKAQLSSKKIEFNRHILKVLNGQFLDKDSLVSMLPFFGYLTLLGLLYIANSYYTEKSIREINSLKKEIKELRAEYITIKSDLMYKSKLSEVNQFAGKLGLHESEEPHYKLVKSK